MKPVINSASSEVQHKAQSAGAEQLPWLPAAACPPGHGTACCSEPKCVSKPLVYHWDPTRICHSWRIPQSVCVSYWILLVLFIFYTEAGLNHFFFSYLKLTLLCRLKNPTCLLSQAVVLQIWIHCLSYTKLKMDLCVLSSVIMLAGGGL